MHGQLIQAAMETREPWSVLAEGGAMNIDGYHYWLLALPVVLFVLVFWIRRTRRRMYERERDRVHCAE